LSHCALALACAATLLAAGVSADDAAERATLKGLAGLRFVVSESGLSAGRKGLNKQELQSALEKRLRAAGVALLAENERARGTPALILNLDLAPADDGQTAFVYSLDLMLVQEVRLLRMPSVRVQTATWKTAGAIGIVEADRLEMLRDASTRAVDSFIAAYRAANTAK
jgi:hypothetical protein